MNVFVAFALTFALALGTAGIAAMLVPWFGRRFVSLSARVADIVFVALALAYVFVFGALSLLRHESFHSGGFDLGIFDQVVWNSLQGRLFENSIRIDAPSFLGQHFSPLLLILVPLYALWSDARTLLVTQTVALAAAGLPVYWWARKHLGPTLAVVVASAYFLFPSLQYVNLFEFHEIVLATPLLAFSLYFLLRQRYPPFLVCLLLSLFAKEEVAFIVTAVGVYLFFVPRKRKLGIALALFGVAYAVVAFKYVIPFFFGNSYDANFFVMERYLYLGKRIPEVITTAITQPGLVIQHLLVPLKIEFVLQLLVPLAFIPLLGGEVLALLAPTLGYLLIGDYVYQNSVHYQYTAPIIPFLFFAFVIGLERLANWNRTAVFQTALAVCIVVAALANYFFQAAGPLAFGFDPDQYAMNARVALGHQLLAQIPRNAPIMVEANLVPHLSQRQYVYQAPNTFDLRPIEYLFADTRFGPYKEYQSTWDDVLATPYFETIIAQDGYILKKRAVVTVEHPMQIRFDDRITLLGYTIESGEPAQRGDNIVLVLVWRADQPIRERYIVFMHLLDAHNQIQAQGDREPANGWFRTDRLDAGDVIADRYKLELSTTISPGQYEIKVGLYDVATNQRLGTDADQDHLTLTTVEIK